MKKLLLLAFCIAFTGMFSYAQVGMPKLPGKITDIPAGTAKVSSNIAKAVGGFTKEEETGVKEATSKFLGDYNSLLPKMKLDPSGFLSGLDKLKNAYDGKLKSIIGASKFAKFAGDKLGAGATKVLEMLM